ncbi:MAG: phospholipase D family protein [Xanthomonadaceae bacterium]|nr:phospholipase D family protein [Xanthomonadaceae bacterium]MDE1965574.1 phospholipase D family protein [Xanthomonadaceae bacterium]
MYRHLPAFALVLLAALLPGCATLHRDFVRQPSTAEPPRRDTPDTRYVQHEVARHPGLSGFRLLTFSSNALMSRVVLADHARHTLDLQYYLFADDDTGRLVAQRLLAAADRGVRVRLLLDDINVGGELDMLDALDAHPNIQVRLFNPFDTRAHSGLAEAAQFVLDGSRLNHRMHNKSFIMDNTVAVIGGRNIGDDYFDAGDTTHFRDLDLIAIGPVVRQASQAFDAYWNCDASYPLKAYDGKHAGPAELAKLRRELDEHARRFAQSDYAQATLDQLPHGPSGDRPGKWFWGHAVLVADQPAKIHADDPELRIGPDIRALMDGARHDIRLISPYFIPGDDGTRFLTGIAARGVRVQVLTNSLASTDEPAVHAGYSRYREPLLRGGVELYELRPQPGEKQPATDAGKSSGVSLHAKAIVVDSRETFIGSMNMDERSRLLNTEMGIIVDNAPLAKAVERFFDSATAPTRAWRVLLDPSEPPQDASLVWRGMDDGHMATLTSEPDATAARKVEVGLIKLLPVENLL